MQKKTPFFDRMMIPFLSLFYKVLYMAPEKEKKNLGTIFYIFAENTLHHL